MNHHPVDRFSTPAIHQATPAIPSTQQSRPVVSCVFCIDASAKAQLNWKSYGAPYLTSFLKALQLLYPDAVYQLTPIFFTSLPPAVPASQSITQPYPFIDLNQFSALLSGFLPLKYPVTNLTSDPNHSLDHGGDYPAILDAIIRALELLDRKTNSNLVGSRTKNQLQPAVTHHKHILILTSTDIGPPSLPLNLNKTNHVDPLAEEYPRTVPVLNQSLEYDGVTFQDLIGRSFQDANGKSVGVLEQKSIILGLISTTRVPRLLSFVARTLGRGVFHASRTQNLVSPLHRTHYIVLSGFAEIKPPLSAHNLANLSSRNPISTQFPSNPNIDGSIIPNDLVIQHIQDRQLQTSNKRPRTESGGDDQASGPPSSHPFAAPSFSAPHPMTGRTGMAPLPNHIPGMTNIVPPQDSPSQAGKAQHALQFLPSSSAPPVASAQPESSFNAADNSLAQGLSLLIGGNKTSPLPQTTGNAANNSFTNPPAAFPPNRALLSSGVGPSTQTPPNDALSQALALLGGGSGIGGSSSSFPVPNMSPAPTTGPQNLLPTSQSAQVPHQKNFQPSPHEQQSHQATQVHNQLQPHLQAHQSNPQASQQPFQAQQSVQPKQQQQLQQLQQLQESQKNQNQDYGSQRPLSQAGGHGLLPAASIIPSQSQTGVQQQINMILDSNLFSGRAYAPIVKGLMVAAQNRARDQVQHVDAKITSGEYTPEQAYAAKVKIRQLLLDTLRVVALQSGQTVNESGEKIPVPAPNLSPPSASDGPYLWRGKLIWKINLPYHSSVGSSQGSDESIGHRKVIELSLPIGAMAAPSQASKDWLRLTAESWPKVWKVDVIKPINMLELSQKNGIEKPAAMTIHLMKNLDQQQPGSNNGSMNLNGGLSNEDIYSKFCENLGGSSMAAIIKFDESGHGVALIYNSSNRALIGLVYIKTTIPAHLLQPSNSTNITRPNSTGPSRPIGSPNNNNSNPHHHHQQQQQHHHQNNTFNPSNLSSSSSHLAIHNNHNLNNNNNSLPQSNSNPLQNLQLNPQQQQLLQQYLAQQRLERSQALSSSQQQQQQQQQSNNNHNFFSNQPNLNPNINTHNLSNQGLPPSWQ